MKTFTATFALILAGAAQAQSQTPAPAPADQTDWTKQVATLQAPDGEMFSVKRAGDFGCSLTFAQDGKSGDFAIYQIPDAVANFTILPPAEWLEIEDGKRFTIISLQKGADEKNVISFITMPFKRVKDPTRGDVLRAQPSDFTDDKLDRSAVMLFQEHVEEGVEDDQPSLQYNYSVHHSAKAVEIFRDCLSWIKRQPAWQKDYGPNAASVEVPDSVTE